MNPSSTQTRPRRRATYIAPQDLDKENPFAPSTADATPAVPETPAENLDTNDRWLREHIPPHFGTL